MNYIHYFLLMSLLLCVGYLGCNEFIKKTPKKIRQEKAQRETFSEQCGIKADALLATLFTIQQNESIVASNLYQILRSVACGESCCVDTMEIETLKNLVQKLEKTLESAKNYAEALAALQGAIER